MDRAWNPAYDGRTDVDRDRDLIEMGAGPAKDYPDVLWMEDVAGMAGRELRQEPDVPDVSDCALEGMGQINVFGQAA